MSGAEVTTAHLAKGPPPNLAWEEIRDLPRLAEFLKPSAHDNPAKFNDGAAEAGDDLSQPDYDRDFIAALDLASWILRTELRVLAGQPAQTMPTRLANTRDRLATRQAASHTACGTGPPPSAG